jgi:chemotaxis protein CheX
MKAELINPFAHSTADVFATMLNSRLVRGNLQLRSSRLVPEYEVNGVVGITGGITGTVVLSMQENVALRATEVMLGNRPSSLNDEAIDAVGEIINMVAGAAKKYLSAYKLSLSMPMVILGSNTRIGFNSKIDPICIPYLSPWGPLQLEVGIAVTSRLAREASQEAVVS